MPFDPENPVIKLCAKGMELEAAGKPAEAASLFMQAWQEAKNDFEKFTAAHYVARQQTTVEDKLLWDKRALDLIENIKDDSMLANYPSLYLNIAKCYEDLKELDKALENYKLALSYVHHLPDEGYGKMIRAGIEKGMERITGKINQQNLAL